MADFFLIYSAVTGSGRFTTHRMPAPSLDSGGSSFLLNIYALLLSALRKEMVSRSGTLSNSFKLSVSTAQLLTIAVAAMIRSWAPIGFPFWARDTNRPACMRAASVVKP